MTSTIGSYCPYDITDDPKLFDLAQRWFSTRFGRMNVMHTRRRSSDTCTVLLHGVGASWADWTPLLLEAKEQRQDLGDLILVDLPGFGDSENTQKHLDIELVGLTIVELVRDQGYSNFRLAGHSMGGFLSLDIASRRYPELRSVHLIAGAYFSIVRVVQEPIRNLFTNPIVAIVYGGLNVLAALGGVGRMLTHAVGELSILNPLLTPFVVHPRQLGPRTRRALSTDPRPASFLKAAHNGRNYDARSQWARISVPVFGVFGAQDRLVPPRDMEELMEVLPSASLTLVDNAAHLVHIEQPALTLASIFATSGSKVTNGPS
jgi:pimeloyl-ACP methyl ester carboxylesterase